MKKLVNPQDSIFEEIKRVDENGAEYWSARDMAKVLEYLEYRNFLPVIKKAKEACVNSQHKVDDHFVDMHEMVTIGSGAKRPLESVKLSRYACYLIVQNADPSKKGGGKRTNLFCCSDTNCRDSADGRIQSSNR